MVGLIVFVVCIVIGEGGSGGVFVLGVGNCMLMFENLMYFVIFFEGVVFILWKDFSFVKKVVEIMKIIVFDLLELGIIDDMIKEVKGGVYYDIKQQVGYIDGIFKEILKFFF